MRNPAPKEKGERRRAPIPGSSVDRTLWTAETRGRIEAAEARMNEAVRRARCEDHRIRDETGEF